MHLLRIVQDGSQIKTPDLDIELCMEIARNHQDMVANFLINDDEGNLFRGVLITPRGLFLKTEPVFSHACQAIEAMNYVIVQSIHQMLRIRQHQLRIARNF